MDVIRGDRLSTSGAIGIAQFLPETAEDLGIDPLNTDQAIEGAARYLRQIMDGANQTGAPVDLTTAIYMYNAGPYRPKYPWGTENRNYYPKVLTAAMKYGNGAESLQPSSGTSITTRYFLKMQNDEYTGAQREEEKEMNCGHADGKPRKNLYKYLLNLLNRNKNNLLHKLSSRSPATEGTPQSEQKDQSMPWQGGLRRW